MAKNKNSLFKAFGELLYAVAAVDGLIQEEEKQLIAQVLSHHHYAFEIISSFQSHVNKKYSIPLASQMALETFVNYGHFEGYSEFKEILQELAISCNGISDQEKILIDHFFEQLEERLS